MVNKSGANGHYNGTRKSLTVFNLFFCNLRIILIGPPDSELGPALHDYARRSLPLAQRLDYLLKDFGYKIRYTFTTYCAQNFE
jgi:hypothetical protein